jgi:hypothetical protein
MHVCWSSSETAIDTAIWDFLLREVQAEALQGRWMLGDLLRQPVSYMRNFELAKDMDDKPFKASQAMTADVAVALTGCSLQCSLLHNQMDSNCNWCVHEKQATYLSFFSESE